MKKTLKMVPLLIAFILVLSACAGEDISGEVEEQEEKTDISGTISEYSTPEIEVSGPDTEESDADTEASTTDTEASASEAEVSTADTGASDTKESTYEMGSTYGGIYTNDFLGIGCELDGNWTYYNEEQLAELNGVVFDALEDDEELSNALEESIDSGRIVYDMYAASSDGFANVNIIFENLGVVYGVTMDENEYIDASSDTLLQALESMGIENIEAEKTSVEFAGTPSSAMAITGEYSEIPIYELLICIKKGNYMAVITLSSYYENITEYVAGLFYSIDG